MERTKLYTANINTIFKNPNILAINFAINMNVDSNEPPANLRAVCGEACI
jgi:hypothetical protein